MMPNRFLASCTLAAALVAPPCRAASLADLDAQPGEWFVTTGGAMTAKTFTRSCYRGPDILAAIVTGRLGVCEAPKTRIGETSATIDASCSIAGAKLVLHSSIALSGPDSLKANNALHFESAGSAAEPLAFDSTTSVRARRIGPCVDAPAKP